MTPLVELGGLAGVAALLTALAGIFAQLHQTRKLREDTVQLQPDHGSSVADLVAATAKEVEKTAAEMKEVRRLIGHEIGEVRDDLVDVKARLRRLEGADHSTDTSPPAEPIDTRSTPAPAHRRQPRYQRKHKRR